MFANETVVALLEFQVLDKPLLGLGNGGESSRRNAPNDLADASGQSGARTAGMIHPL